MKQSLQLVLFNGALIPDSDQYQISPCNINAYSIPEVMRIKDMITLGEFALYFLITSPQYFFKKSMGQDRRICSLILGVKG